MLTLFTDTDTDITPEVAKEYGYHLISMPYAIDGKNVYPYEDFDEFDAHAFYDQLRDGVLYYTFGYPKGGYPVQVMAFDVRQKRLLWEAANMDEAFRGEEIECCDWYRGQLLCNTNGGSLYTLRFREEKGHG